MEMTTTVRDGDSQVENFIKVENGIYTHRQIEHIAGKVFMRIKQRKLIEVEST